MSAAHKSAAFKFQFLFPQYHNGRFFEVDEIRSIIQIEVYIKKIKIMELFGRYNVQ